jgi:hypothetical protein
MSDEDLWAAVGVTWGVIGAAYAALCIWLGVRLFNRRERWAKWTAVALAIMPALYILSSGPMTIVGFRTRVKHTSTILPNGTSAIQASSETSLGKWFSIAYAPLVLAAEQAWGDSVFSYWELFPNRSNRLADEEP